jgi:hypothetical protein
MNPPRKSRKRTRRNPRTSTYAHLWPELAHMPPLNHWPDRPNPFTPERSQVLAFIADGYGCDLREAGRIFRSARDAGVIRFVSNTKRWRGTKGGKP